MRGEAMKYCLILDDSSSIRRVTARILESLGYGAATAGDSEAALEACGVRMPDCIVVDWTMPGFDPVRFMARLRRMPDGDRPTVMSCLFENDPDLAGRARQKGAGGALLKPFDTRALRSSLVACGLL